MGSSPARHFGMDWLRIGAFQLLIFYHVGMAFVPWAYQVKVVSPAIDWTTIPMLVTNPWRLSLLFLVSGYASAALFARDRRVGPFIRSRLARLGIPLLFGMAVVVVPQPWVWLVTHYGYPYGFGHFVTHDYYRFQSISGVAMPTWMHLWFVVYLLAYTMLLGGLLALPDRWRGAGCRTAERLLGGPLLLPLGMLWAYGARAWLSPGWEDNHAFAGDWSAHVTYLAAFLFGYLLRGSERLQAAIVRWWPTATVAAVGGWLILAGFEIAWPGDTRAPAWAWPMHGVARSVQSWGAIVALIGIADRFWNVDHRWRPMLAEAVYPFYLVHQTMIIVVGYWLLPTATGPLARFVLLVAATVAGCWGFYLVGRKLPWMRPLIGLRYAGLRQRLQAVRGGAVAA